MQIILADARNQVIEMQSKLDSSEAALKELQEDFKTELVRSPILPKSMHRNLGHELPVVAAD